MMFSQNLINLHRKGYLTDQQMLVGKKFRENPTAFKLAPTLYRILFDLIINDVPLETFEKQRGWAARSAKVMLSQLLYALQEVQGDWWGNEYDQSSDYIKFLIGEDESEISEAMISYGFTSIEARLFIILKNDQSVLSKETIIRRLYHNRSEDEVPTLKIVDVLVCKIRKKLPDDLEVQTIWGEGFRLVERKAA